MNLTDAVIIAFWLQLFSILWNLLFLALIGLGIYAFRNKIKEIIKDIIKEAIKEMKE